MTLAVLTAVAAAMVLAVLSLEGGSREDGTAAVMKSLSNGCFFVCVLYIGCGVLMYIQEAGNFYGIQFLFYTMAHLFSPRKSRAAERKTYYTYCLEKKGAAGCGGQVAGQAGDAPDGDCLPGTVPDVYGDVLSGAVA